jgi:outer membrane receptor for ferrienterochelin and colicins
VETQPFWDLGLKLAYEIPLYRFYTLEINAGVKNLLDSFQPDIDKGVNRDASYIYGPSLPRTYFVGLNLKI